jgi:S1-C subfamily serine protease
MLSRLLNTNSRFTHLATSAMLTGVVSLCVALCGLCTGCSSSATREVGLGSGLEWQKIRQQIREIESSVLPVAVESQYRVEVYNYELVNGSFVRDEGSPTGYLLQRGEEGITTTVRNQEVYGTGLLLYQDSRRAAVLTNRHLVTVPDTINTFYLDKQGNPTDVLFSRVTKIKSVNLVIAMNGWRRAAEVAHTDSVSDLGLLLVEWDAPIGAAFSRSLGYELELDWGSLVVVFGCPRGVKQLALGITSPSPYPGTFAVDAASRFGFSGGPVLVVTEGNELKLGGLVRGTQVDRIQYVSPPPGKLPGQSIGQDEMKELKVEEYTIAESGLAFVVDPPSIGRFLNSIVPSLARKGIVLSSRLLPPT